MPENSTETQRFQAAIYGDTLDTCLVSPAPRAPAPISPSVSTPLPDRPFPSLFLQQYSSNCNEFITWGNRDDVSWLNDYTDRGVASGTLFGRKGEKKLVYYEMLARLQRFADGGDEPCATSDGIEQCVLDPNA